MKTLMYDFVPQTGETQLAREVIPTFSPSSFFHAAEEPSKPVGSRAIQTNNGRFGCQAHWTAENISATHIFDSCGPMDILAGRSGKRMQNILGKDHLGTQIFEEAITRNLPAYRHQSHRNDRSCLIKKVVCDLLAKGCRFVKYDGKANRFLVLNEKQIRDKVSFAFRHQGARLGPPFATIKGSKSLEYHLQDEVKAVARATNKKKGPSSPCSVTMSSPLLDGLAHGGGFFLGAAGLPQPTFDDRTPRSSQVTAYGANCGASDDEQDFIDMINNLHVDGLTLSEEEIDISFDMHT